MEIILNNWGELLVGKLGSIYYIYGICLVSVLLLFLLLKYIFGLNWKIIIPAEVVLIAFLFVALFTGYRNGEKIIELKTFGLKIVNCIDSYKKDRNSLPQSLNDLNSCLSPAEIERANRLAKYNVFKKDELNKPYKNESLYKEDDYSLSIYEEFLGFYYLAYSEKEKKFIYTDD